MRIQSKILSTGISTAVSVALCVCSLGCKENADSSAGASGAAPESKGATAEADNSARNSRDRDEAALTSGDQGNSSADRDITQKVRRKLVAGDEYSTTAKNVKIITAGGKVTLRGPVKSDAEKNGIVAIAKTVAGEGNVEDQLEVKANP